MSRYIDAELLEKKVSEPSMFDINKDDVLALIAEISTADVVEVRHGEWIYIDGDVGYSECKCSVCNESIVFAEGEDRFIFCPNCGAKMDGSERRSENEG